MAVVITTSQQGWMTDELQERGSAAGCDAKSVCFLLPWAGGEEVVVEE